MKFVIMCGGVYDHFETPKQLSVIHGERLVDRTIRLLRENGANDIYITATDKRFDTCNAIRLEHKNSYKYENGKLYGYWLDAFYPHFDKSDKITYLFGDVYYTKAAITQIVNYQTNGNVMFGSGIAKNEQHQNWGEPFAYIVNDYKTFMQGVEDVKKLQDEGKTNRIALVWELYRYLNNLDINVQRVLDETYVCIDDGTIDIDAPWQIEKIEKEMAE